MLKRQTEEPPEHSPDSDVVQRNSYAVCINIVVVCKNSVVVCSFCRIIFIFVQGQTNISEKTDSIKTYKTMATKYTMQRMNDLNREGETVLYPKMIIGSCCDTEELAERMAHGTTFNKGEILGIFHLLSKEMAGQMASGRSVKINDIGTFTPSLTLKKGKERESPDGTGSKRNAESIEVGKVNFRPSKKFVHEVDKQCVLERTSQVMGYRVSKYTPEERLRIAQEHLETHATLTVAVYAELTGLSRTTAGKELKGWYKTPGSGIGIEGRGSHRIYVKKA